VALLVALTGCDDANQKDATGVHWRQLDKIEVYSNIDQHPNIARVCIDGVAFATISREYNSILRVPEWDSWCKS
jgi:hypothetical protein